MALGFDSPKAGEPQEATGAELQGAKLHHRRPMGSLLSAAVHLWLRSQVQQVDELRVQIEGGDRQILSGQIPGVSLDARGAVYQGLHLTQIHLVGTGILVNIGQVVRGKPLRILEPIPIVGELLLEQSDLNASLEAPLLANALIEFLLPFLSPASAVGAIDRSALHTLKNPQIIINEGQLMLSAQLADSSGTQIAFVLHAGLQLASGHELEFVNTDLQVANSVPMANLQGFKLDFGPDVDIQELTLSPGKLVCRGRILVIP